MANNGASPLNRFLFVQRWPNGGYNSVADASKRNAYSNPSMPNFIPAGEAGVTGGGETMYFDVIDGAQSFNGEATGASNSVTPYFTSGAAEGVTIGKIVYNEITATWNFVSTVRNHPLPNATDANSDANAIKAFVTSLNSGVIPVTGTATEVPLPPPQSDLVNDATSVNDQMNAK